MWWLPSSCRTCSEARSCWREMVALARCESSLWVRVSDHRVLNFFLFFSFFPNFWYHLLVSVRWCLSNSSILYHHRPPCVTWTYFQGFRPVVKIEFENKLLSKRHQKCDARFLTCFSLLGRKSHGNYYCILGAISSEFLTRSNPVSFSSHTDCFSAPRKNEGAFNRLEVDTIMGPSGPCIRHLLSNLSNLCQNVCSQGTHILVVVIPRRKDEVVSPNIAHLSRSLKSRPRSKNLCYFHPNIWSIQSRRTLGRN